MKIPPVYVMHHKSFLSIIHKTFLVYQNLGVVFQIALLGTWVFHLHCINVSSSNSQCRSVHAIPHGVTHKMVDRNNLLRLKTHVVRKRFLIVCFLQSLWRRANARNVSFFYSLRWPIYVFKSVVNTELTAPQKVMGS